LSTGTLALCRLEHLGDTYDAPCLACCSNSWCHPRPCRALRARLLHPGRLGSLRRAAFCRLRVNRPRPGHSLWVHSLSGANCAGCCSDRGCCRFPVVGPGPRGARKGVGFRFIKPVDRPSATPRDGIADQSRFPGIRPPASREASRQHNSVSPDSRLAPRQSPARCPHRGCPDRGVLVLGSARTVSAPRPTIVQPALEAGSRQPMPRAWDSPQRLGALYLVSSWTAPALRFFKRLVHAAPLGLPIFGAPTVEALRSGGNRLRPRGSRAVACELRFGRWVQSRHATARRPCSTAALHCAMAHSRAGVPGCLPVFFSAWAWRSHDATHSCARTVSAVVRQHYSDRRFAPPCAGGVSEALSSSAINPFIAIDAICSQDLLSYERRGCALLSCGRRLVSPNGWAVLCR